MSQNAEDKLPFYSYIDDSSDLGEIFMRNSHTARTKRENVFSSSKIKPMINVKSV